MKKIFVLLAVGFALFSCNKGKKNDLQRENLKGKVKSVRTIDYEAVEKFGEVQKGNIFDNVLMLFNKLGNFIELDRYNSDGSLYGKIILKYDDKDNQIEDNRYDSDGNLVKKKTLNTMTRATE